MSLLCDPGEVKREREREREWGGEGGRGGVTKRDEMGESPMTEHHPSQDFFPVCGCHHIDSDIPECSSKVQQKLSQQLMEGRGGGGGRER